MNLSKYLWKNVELKSTNGKTWIGYVCDFEEAEDNESGYDSITLDINDGNLWEFDEPDIVSIKIID